MSKSGYAKVTTRAVVGVTAPPVTVEVHISGGLPALAIVGLPEASVREAKERVRSAILNSELDFPAKRITIHLAPADLPKAGGRYDLAIAVGILVASGQLPATSIDNMEFISELSLSGELKGIKGILPCVCELKNSQRQLLCSDENGFECAMVEGANTLLAPSLLAVYHHLNGNKALNMQPEHPPLSPPKHQDDLSDIIGQQAAKRALVIAAAGKHNVLLCGPPGTGKSMLAKRLLTLLPELNDEDALATAAIHSVVGESITPQSWKRRPFRSPHHTASAVALAGGGSQPKPGEVTLAHNGVLFLDELPEYSRQVLDVLREPLEARHICIARSHQKITYPANFQLVAAMNPSPTGNINDGRSSPQQINKYLSRISGPLLDRIDLQIDVPSIAIRELTQRPQQATGMSSKQARQYVIKAQHRQYQRQGCLNADISAQQLDTICVLSEKVVTFLEDTLAKLNLSARSYHRVLKVARTIADLEQTTDIQTKHIAEALGYRSVERMMQHYASY